jgi:Beta-1,3-glucanase
MFSKRTKLLALFSVLLTLVVVGVAIGVIATGNAKKAQASADYSQTVVVSSSTSIVIQFTSNVNSAWVDVHYTVSPNGQLNLRMAQNGNVWSQNVTGLASGNVVSYWFTYEKSGAGYDTTTYTYTVGSTVPTATSAPTNGTPTPTTSSSSFWGDTSSIPAAKNVMMFKFLNRTNGKYPDSQVYWSFNGQTHSIADQPYFDMPVVPGSRMYFYLGSPTSQYTDFIEFNTGPSQFNGNTTRVDWFGIKLALRLHTKDGKDVSVGEDQATFAEDRSVTFQKFIDSVPAEFKHLAQIKAPYMIPAPGKMSETDFLPGGQYANYMTSYAQSLGLSATTFDIFACANSLSQNSPLCAALNRHVAQLPQSQWTTPSLFYQTAPANYYAKFWHDHSINHLAYGFPYDDSGDQSTYLSYSNPQYMLVAIGW